MERLKTKKPESPKQEKPTKQEKPAKQEKPTKQKTKKTKKNKPSKKSAPNTKIKKSNKRKMKERIDSDADSGIILIDDDLTVDKQMELEERKAYLEEARSQDSLD